MRLLLYTSLLISFAASGCEPDQLRERAVAPDWQVRSHAIRRIGELRDPTLLPVVHAALADERLEVRESAARVLIAMGDSSSLPYLRKALSDRAGIVRSHAAEALIAIGGTSELPAARHLIENDDDPTARAATVRVLGELDDPAVVPILKRALDDQSPIVRGEAAAALKRRGDR